jgi:hypothetical protein
MLKMGSYLLGNYLMGDLGVRLQELKSRNIDLGEYLVELGMF